jgi:hypothetical protein
MAVAWLGSRRFWGRERARKSESKPERGGREKGDMVQLGCSKGVASAWKRQAGGGVGRPGAATHLPKVEDKGGFAKSPLALGSFLGILEQH